MERYPAVKLWPRCCMLAVVALLGYPQVGAAAGTWSVISLPQKPGEVSGPNALAVDAAGNLFVADSPAPSHLGQNQRRDAQGNWSVIATQGASALAVDAAGNLYVAGGPIAGGAIQKQDAQGSWSVIAMGGDALGQVNSLSGLAVDAAGNLYVADIGNDRVQVYTPNGSP